MNLANAKGSKMAEHEKGASGRASTKGKPLKGKSA
jgi:hypothetical protein